MKGPGMITPGTVLIEKDTVLPPSLRLEEESSEGSWRRVKSSFNFHELETVLAATGWTFFYLAGRITATAFGFDRQKAVSKALRRLIASVGILKCNCLEIDEVAVHTFWGIPYVSVSAHSRNIQKGVAFAAH
jgi:hypothetical protein